MLDFEVFIYGILEKEMAIHSRTIAWKIQWTEERGRLQSIGSQRVGHDRYLLLNSWKCSQIIVKLPKRSTEQNSYEDEKSLEVKWKWKSGLNTRVSSLSLLQGIFPTQGLNQVSHIAGGFFTSWATGKPKNSGVGSLSLLQVIFLTQESNRGLLHCRQILYQLRSNKRLIVLNAAERFNKTKIEQCSLNVTWKSLITLAIAISVDL